MNVQIAKEPAEAIAPLATAGATPMMEQYIEIKTANPDSLLFYRMGDFYELFFDDAEQASRALGIVLTKRGKHKGDDIPMCGVPVHAADDYLQKLIGLGFRVAVCEQTEDPAEAKKRGSKSVVRRDVVRLVTPGTITEDKLLAPSEANFLMALGRVRAGEGAGGQALALAWIDISTGAFRVAETSADRLVADVFRVDPKELIVAEPVFHDGELRPALDAIGRIVNPQPAALFDSTAAPGRIARFYGVATTDSFGSFSRAELSAISGAVAYVEKTQKAERPPLARPEREQAGSTLFIDPATRANLELLRTLSGEPRAARCSAAIDRTLTGAGRPPARRAADGAADRSRRDRRAARLGLLLLRRAEPCECAGAVPEARPRHAPRPVAPGAQPGRAARPRRASPAASACGAEIAELLARTPSCRRNSRARAALAALPAALTLPSRGGARRRAAAAEARRRLRPRRLRRRARRDAGAARRIAARHRGDGARADRGDGHPLAEDPPQQRARLLHRGDRQPPGDHDRDGRGARRASSTGRPWPARCASPRPSSPTWRRRSPTPPTGRCRSSSPSSTGWSPKP